MNKPTEKWLPVPNHPQYLVSNLGRVRSIRHKRMLKQTKVKHGGYLVVVLDGKQVRVHRAVMTAFVGPVPDGMEVCHQDGDPENNELTNLRYDTHLANVQDMRKHGTHPRGVDKGVATRFTEDDVRAIRKAHSEGMSYQQIANRYRIKDRHHIKKIVKRKIWAWVDDEELMYQSRAYLSQQPRNAHKPITFPPTTAHLHTPENTGNMRCTPLTTAKDRSSRSISRSAPNTDNPRSEDM